MALGDRHPRGPSFVGIGAQKAGTSWLHAVLQMHPDIAFPGGKEVHFWDKRRELGVDWYVQLFAGSTKPFTGDITPAYAILAPEVIAEAAALNRALRAIFIMRNPVERAWSAALMTARRQGIVVSETPDAWFLEHFRSPGSVARGDYERCLRHWRGVFGRESVLVERFEHLRSEPRELVRRCLRHIGATADFIDSAPSTLFTTKVFAGPRHPIRPALREALLASYRQPVLRLQEYLQVDLSAWLE